MSLCTNRTRDLYTAVNSLLHQSSFFRNCTKLAMLTLKAYTRDGKKIPAKKLSPVKTELGTSANLVWCSALWASFTLLVMFLSSLHSHALLNLYSHAPLILAKWAKSKAMTIKNQAFNWKWFWPYKW